MFEPLDFSARLAALGPRPRTHLPEAERSRWASSGEIPHLSDPRARLELQRLAVPLGDGHTNVRLLASRFETTRCRCAPVASRTGCS